VPLAFLFVIENIFFKFQIEPDLTWPNLT